MCDQRRFRSDCAFEQSDQNLLWAYFLIAKAAKFLHADNEDTNHTPRMSGGTFSDVAVHLIPVWFGLKG